MCITFVYYLCVLPGDLYYLCVLPLCITGHNGHGNNNRKSIDLEWNLGYKYLLYLLINVDHLHCTFLIIIIVGL